MRNTEHLATCLLGIGLIGFMLAPARAMTHMARGGFTANTIVTLTLEESSIDRFEWWLAHSFQYDIEGTISISGGSGINSGASNKIMLYGDRTEPRLSGESDWQMTPRPLNIYFTSTQTVGSYIFPFGPVYTNPDGLYEEWVQNYNYSAVINLQGGGSRSGSDSLAVADGE